MKENNLDIFAKCYTDQGYFGKLRAGGDRYFSRPTLPAKPSTKMKFQDKECIMWSINNYLGLANHREICEVAEKTLKEYGLSSPMGSRMMSGTTKHHLQFEEELAAWHNKEAAFVFNYGYMGVLGIISSLAGPSDTIIMDKLSHACIVDAAFLSRANVRIFKHNDAQDLERILQSVEKNRKGGVLILTEGMYGMTGDLINLQKIIEVKNKYNARLFIDDAHGCGVLGETGCGVGELYNLSDEIDIYFGTFAKAFASIGGFAVGKKEVIDWIGYNARTQVFAKALPLVYVKSLQKTLELVKGELGSTQRKKMWDNSKQLTSGLKDKNFYLGTGESPLVSVFISVGKDTPLESIAPKTISFLREEGVFVTGIIYPVIPAGLVMYRMIPTAAHSQDEISFTIDKFEKMKNSLQLQTQMSETELQLLSRIY